MSKIKVAINGFGRIGRLVMRKMLSNPNLEVVAVNDLADSKTLSHLFKYDSVHRQYQGEVSYNENELLVDDVRIALFSEKDPLALPWKKYDVDVVLECTGKFLTKEDASKHLEAGAKKVILSAPAKSKDIKTVVLGVNEHLLSKEDVIVSNASCTTNCAAPMIKVLHENWTVEDGYITTVHSYTGDQRLHDAPHRDLRRARAAAMSIVPTSTGAAKAITKIFPDLHGKLGGCGIRVPVPDGSLTDITCVLKEPVDVESLNLAFKRASENELKGILQYTEDPIVSVDIIGNEYSCIFDADFSSVVGNMVKVVGWYDNEMGYSTRLSELITKLF